MPVSLSHLYPALKVTVEPTIEPVTVGEAAGFARYEGSDEASAEILRGLIVTARRKVEKDAAIALITQTREAKFDEFSCGCQDLRIAPVQSVAITYLDEAGELQEWDNSHYQVDTHATPARVAPVDGETWPATACGTLNAATFTIVCGYGDSADDVPDEAKVAIKLLVGEWFNGRCAGSEAPNVMSQYGVLVQGLSWRPMNV